MKKKFLMMLSCCLLAGLAGCGPEAEPAQIEATPITEAAQTETASVAEDAQVTEVTQEETEKSITEEQALAAIRDYCLANNPSLEEMASSGEYGIYWEVSTNEAGEIVVLYRSYTGSQTRYYIDPESGDTYVTELVPGIMDEEQRTEESLNIYTIMAGN